MRTRSVCIGRWRQQGELEPPFASVLRFLASHRPCASYSIVVHGSALWGDRTVLECGEPVSDIDILIIGKQLDDLSCAAKLLRPLCLSIHRPQMPLFKLSAKLRTVDEIAGEPITANELAAVENGAILCGEPIFEIAVPDRQWFGEQARLAFRTRIAYTALQVRAAQCSPYWVAIERYLASRLILDIATVGLLLLANTMGRSYTNRVALLQANLNGDQLRIPKEILHSLRLALRTKRNPERHSCGTLSEALSILRKGVRDLGLLDADSFSLDGFWECERPLDMRDRELWPNLLHG